LGQLELWERLEQRALPEIPELLVERDNWDQLDSLEILVALALLVKQDLQVKLLALSHLTYYRIRFSIAVNHMSGL
jgi:hypothetical protein